MPAAAKGRHEASESMHSEWCSVSLLEAKDVMQPVPGVQVSDPECDALVLEEKGSVLDGRWTRRVAGVTGVQVPQCDALVLEET